MVLGIPFNLIYHGTNRRFYVNLFQEKEVDLAINCRFRHTYFNGRHLGDFSAILFWKIFSDRPF